jgi:hypothetical protein
MISMAEWLQRLGVSDALALLQVFVVGLGGMLSFR